MGPIVPNVPHQTLSVAATYITEFTSGLFSPRTPSEHKRNVVRTTPTVSARSVSSRKMTARSTCWKFFSATGDPRYVCSWQRRKDRRHENVFPLAWPHVFGTLPGRDTTTVSTTDSVKKRS
jgi:hypothetical protein